MFIHKVKWLETGIMEGWNDGVMGNKEIRFGSLS
jgi:hypothetical protein